MPKQQPSSPIDAFLAFIDEHLSAPLDPAEEQTLFALDMAAGQHCASLRLNVPEFGTGDRTPYMKLNFERESCYKYPGALTCEPQIPEGETEHYGICLDPHENWMLWLRALSASAIPRQRGGTSKKRPDRLADIQRLIKVVARKIQESVDHAAETWIRTGTPEVLPRCDRKDIGAECGLPDYTTSKCFSDEDAQQLNEFWDKLGDRNWILEVAEQRRNSRR